MNMKYRIRIDNKNNKIRNIIMIKFLIILNLFIQSLLNNDLIFAKFNFSAIKLKIIGIGSKKIFQQSKSFFNVINYPIEIFINSVKQNVVNYSYYFYQTENLIELRWNHNINNTRYMFFECHDIIEMDLSNFDSSHITDMSYMFRECESLTLLNLTNFDTSQVTDMSSMFRECSSLTLLNLSHFITKEVLRMDYMFKSCSSLTSLNISYFDTSKVTNMDRLFEDCFQLTSLDLSSFDTSNTIYMLYMFNNCKSLLSLDLSNFNTFQVLDIEMMFRNCISLTSLDLSNFDTSQVKWMNSLFEGCLNLEYINMKNFVEDSLRIYSNMFTNIPENVVVCINHNNIKILSELNKTHCYNIDCSSNWKLSQNKIINDTGKCIDKCEKDLEYKYEYNGKCYKSCINGLLDYTKCKCELDKCQTCPDVSLSIGLYTKCNDNFYQMENDNANKGEYFNCYKDLYGYYLDKIDLLYKKCYEKCETCVIKGDNITHNCLKCKRNYSFGIIFDNYTNCYQNCSHYHYLDSNNNTFCTNDFSCPEEYPLLIREKFECQKYIRSNNITEIMENILFNYIKNETEDTEKEEIKFNDMIIKNIEKCFISGEYDKSFLENGTDDIFEYSNLLITLTTSSNQKKKFK